MMMAASQKVLFKHVSQHNDKIVNKKNNFGPESFNLMAGLKI